MTTFVSAPHSLCACSVQCCSVRIIIDWRPGRNMKTQGMLAAVLRGPAVRQYFRHQHRVSTARAHICGLFFGNQCNRRDWLLAFMVHGDNGDRSVSTIYFIAPQSTIPQNAHTLLYPVALGSPLGTKLRRFQLCSHCRTLFCS